MRSSRRQRAVSGARVDAVSAGYGRSLRMLVGPRCAQAWVQIGAFEQLSREEREKWSNAVAEAVHIFSNRGTIHCEELSALYIAHPTAGQADTQEQCR